MNAMSRNIVGRWPVVIGFAALIGMIGLLGFGNRSLSIMSAGSNRSFTECTQDLLYECPELSRQAQPLVQPPTQWSNENSFIQPAAEGVGFLSIAAFENAGLASGGQVVERCLLPGAPCFAGNHHAFSGEHIENAGEPSGEREAVGDIFLTIPVFGEAPDEQYSRWCQFGFICDESADYAEGDPDAERRISMGIRSFENRGNGGLSPTDLITY